MKKSFTIKAKITLISIFSLVFLGISIIFLSVSQSTQALLEAEYNKLTTLNVTKNEEIRHYFSSLKALLISLANSKITQDAFLGFEEGFYKLEGELNIDIKMIEKNLQVDFQSNYLNSVNYSVPNSEQRKELREYIPTLNSAKIAQYLFITNNKYNLGEKNKLINDEKFSSTYMNIHKVYHPTLDKFLSEFSLYDIFMVDLKGNLIYTDFKEKDFATNLNDGVYSNSGLGKVYKKALTLNNGELAFEDFMPYEPSYNASASFIATPIYINNEKKGVLIFQMPVDKINSIMGLDGKFEESGLGKSGEVYLVGQDYKMRNNSRFIKDIDDKVVQELNSTIGVWKIESNATQKALKEFSKDEIGKDIIVDYRGIEVLSVYSKIDIFDTTSWAIIAEIDKEEAFTPAYNLRNLITIISFAIVLVVVFIILFFINRIIVSPLKSFQDGLLAFFKYLNKENNEVKNLEIKSNDEIGIMSSVVNDNINIIKVAIEKEKALIEDASKVINIVNSGDLKTRITLNSDNKGLNELKELINQMLNNLEGNISSILEVLSQYSNYNYLNSVDKKNLKGEIEELIDGINILGESITSMLIENQKNGLILQKGSINLLNNVEVLNTSANEAAASLEETAAALEEITSTVINNSNNVQKMSENTKELTTAVLKGQELALNTTKSMDDINEQVDAITEAISVIDQIAFQTNILSLNAAVEAATAGEAGLGFAVVAQEVRNLASRSAQAANEIKHIVEQATLKANEGKKIAAQMIEGYTLLNENINGTIELITEVNAASKEQQSGIEQINDAVTLLDQQTQKNASIANQTQDISLQTNKIAIKIVEDANTKEFKGKK